MSGEHTLIAGRYRLERRVGTGGMGVVWEGWDERLQRKVAVKQLHAQPGLGDAEAELTKLRAMREARITARLDHPHAVPVFDVVEHDGQPCLIMQFLPSTPLSLVLRDLGVMSVQETARIGAQVASALAAAHRVSIVHRDVKPGNILIAEDGTARISDFGISHALGDANLTATGMVHGTPAYLAPEVALGGDSSFASDVFGLGATLYAALEGGPPFGSDTNSIALLHRVAAGRFTPPARAGALAPLLLQMLARTPSDRPTMSEAARRLTGLAADAGAEPDTLRFADPIEGPASGRAPVAPPVRSVPPAAATGADSSQGLSTPPPAVPPPGPAPDVAAASATLAAPRSSGGLRSSDGPGGDGQPPVGVRGGDDRRAGGPRRRRRRVLPTAIAVVAALLALAVVAYVVLPSLSGRVAASFGQGATPTADPTSTQGSASPTATSSAPSSPARSSAAPTTTAPKTTAPTATAPTTKTAPTATAAPTTTAPTKTAPTKTAPTTTAPTTTAPTTTAPTSSSSSTSGKSPTSSSPKPVQGTPSAGQLEDAITGYYDVMPGSTDAGWSRLTTAYQKRSGGRASYDHFWGSIDRVSVRDVQGEKPDRVTARIRYSFSNGRVETDETSYRLVDVGGSLKINSTKVLSSSTS